MPSSRGRRWTISRRDLAAGGAELVRLSHPLLPHVVLARPAEAGLLLHLASPPPSPVGPAPAGIRRGFLARLAALLGFLRFHGLGVAAADVGEIGAWPGRPERPSLGEPPVPAWRAAPPALVLAAVAARFGSRLDRANDASGLRAAVSAALERGLVDGSAEDAVTCLAALEADGRPEALAMELARRGDAPPGRDLLGLAFPSGWVEVPNGTGGAASGAAAEWLARGAARRAGVPAFLECAPSGFLEEGSALREIARRLDGDPRGADVRALAEGRRPKLRDPGLPLALVALEADRWDARSRRALADAFPEMGIRVFEACAGPFRPWEARPVLGLRIPDGDASSLAYLPFASLPSALEAWRGETAGAGADAARFLRAVHALASRFEARTGTPRPGARPATRPEPVLAAAALLADGFGAREAAAAAAATPEDAASALDAAEARGILVRKAVDAYRFRDEGERAKLARRVPAAARREAVVRLEAMRIPPGRLVPAALARGDPNDLEAALALLETDPGRAGELFARAPRRDPDLGAARAPRARRLAAASALAREGHAPRALALCPGGGLEEDLLRARLLVELRRHAEARRLVERALAAPGAPVTARVDALLLAAELDERTHRYAEAGERLGAAGRLLADIADPELAARAARTAGYLANDLGRSGEAMALFRRAGELARGARSRADAAYDVAHAALDGGKLDVAARELDEALALYAAAGDERRYLSALGNRIDLFLRMGDASAARAVLDRVLAHERAAGRAHQLLFAMPAAQELALLDGDGPGAAAAFSEAAALAAAVDGPHPAWREVLLFESERRLVAGEAAGALALLDEAAAIPDNRSRTEARRRRLRASALRDLGRPDASPELEAGERDLLAAEGALASGASPGGAALTVLEDLAASRDAGLAVRRVLEWAGRFPRTLAASHAVPLLRLGRKAAVRAGLARAVARFDGLLERPVPPPEGPHAAVARGAPPASLVAEDAATRDVLAEVARVAPSRLPILVRGESGTGKELVAREAHRLSGRRGQYVAVNVAALPATLAEAELFGHARGAFSGADRHRAGLVEEASGGTLFLDEIGDLVLPLQGKLLRVLQEGEVRRLGETAVRRVDLRVVAATHRDLAALVDRGEFRGDLYYRLAGHEVVLRPFRERPRDRARLVERVLAGRADLDREAAAAVDRYAWPGNAREIVSVIERAVVLAAPDRTIRLEHLPHALREPPPAAPFDYRKAIEDARRRAIDAALVASNGRRAEAAKLLGISRQSLLYEMKKLGLS